MYFSLNQFFYPFKFLFASVTLTFEDEYCQMTGCTMQENLEYFTVGQHFYTIFFFKDKGYKGKKGYEADND